MQAAVLLPLAICRYLFREISKSADDVRAVPCTPDCTLNNNSQTKLNTHLAQRSSQQLLVLFLALKMFPRPHVSHLQTGHGHELITCTETAARLELVV